MCVMIMVKRQRRSNAVQAYTTGWSTLTDTGGGFGKSGTSWRTKKDKKKVFGHVIQTRWSMMTDDIVLRVYLPEAQHSCWAENSAMSRCCCHFGPAGSPPDSSLPVSLAPSDSTVLPQHQCQGISGAAKPRWAQSGSTCCSHLPQRGWHYQ